MLILVFSSLYSFVPISHFKRDTYSPHPHLTRYIGGDGVSGAALCVGDPALKLVCAGRKTGIFHTENIVVVQVAPVGGHLYCCVARVFDIDAHVIPEPLYFSGRRVGGAAGYFDDVI